MGNCSLCGKATGNTVCDACGFDESRNYERFPTLCAIPKGTDSLAAGKRKWEATRGGYHMTGGTMGKYAVEKIPAKKDKEKQEDEGHICWCCGRKFFGTNCPHCNFIAIRDNSPEHTALIRNLALKHRQQILEELTDFCVISYRYQWDEKSGKMVCVGEDRIKLADGVDCQNVFWSEPIFGQLPQKKGGLVPISLSYRYQGVKHQLELEIPTVRGDNFWQIGLCIDSDLSLLVFLGDPVHFHTAKARAELKLK